jgi:hypothetical protein
MEVQAANVVRRFIGHKEQVHVLHNRCLVGQRLSLPHWPETLNQRAPVRAMAVLLRNPRRNVQLSSPMDWQMGDVGG